jgi:predicted acetyltransferase
MIEREFPDGTRIVSVEHPDGAVSLILEEDGQQVSRTVIVPMLMRIGAAVVRMDGIGGVETEEEYRNRGYSRRLNELAVEKMRAGDAALSTLFGIQDFYPKFGFATVGPEYSVTLPLEDPASAPELPSGWRFRPFEVDDLPAVKRIYHTNTKRAVGALVRHDAGDESEETQRLAHSSAPAQRIGRRAWNRLERLTTDAGKDSCHVLLDEAGAIRAYAWISRGGWWIDFRYRDAPETFHIGEVMATDPVAADVVLTACRRWATQRPGDERGSPGIGSGFQQIEMAIPPDNAVALAATYEGGSFHASHTRNGEFMGRVLDVGRLLHQLRPELAARIGAARIEYSGQLVVRTDEGEASLSITPDGVSVGNGSGEAVLEVEIPQAMLARLCLGAFETRDVLARLPNPPSREAGTLLEALFPKRTPHIYPVDRF